MSVATKAFDLLERKFGKASFPAASTFAFAIGLIISNTPLLQIIRKGVSVIPNVAVAKECVGYLYSSLYLEPSSSIFACIALLIAVLGTVVEAKFSTEIASFTENLKENGQIPTWVFKNGKKVTWNSLACVHRLRDIAIAYFTRAWIWLALISALLDPRLISGYSPTSLFAIVPGICLLFSFLFALTNILDCLLSIEMPNRTNELTEAEIRKAPYTELEKNEGSGLYANERNRKYVLALCKANSSVQYLVGERILYKSTSEGSKPSGQARWNVVLETNSLDEARTIMSLLAARKHYE